jgi:hypothetical protein
MGDGLILCLPTWESISAPIWARHDSEELPPRGVMPWTSARFVTFADRNR